MSHFLALVLIDPSDPDPIERAEHLMLPYWASEFFDDATGERLPNVKCDGFTVGGRYDGLLWAKEQHYSLSPAEFQQRYGLDVVRPEDNLRAVSEIPAGVLPYAIVTPDGRWTDGERLPDEAWRDRVADLLDRHWEHRAVAFDCHC